MKLEEHASARKRLAVAPLAGAWIETSDARAGLLAAKSRPSRARGLKPFLPVAVITISMSRPSRARGLKHPESFAQSRIQAVAPLAGAWIETERRWRDNRRSGSRPSRARGLKRRLTAVFSFVFLSRPSRARGLKPPFARARRSRPQSRPSRARGLKLFSALLSGLSGLSRPSRARGLKPRRGGGSLRPSRRAPRGRVD